jgi:hypothetical protein
VPRQLESDAAGVIEHGALFHPAQRKAKGW